MNAVLARVSARYGVSGPLVRAHELPAQLLTAAVSFVIVFGVLGGLLDWDSVGVSSVYFSGVMLWACGTAFAAIGWSRIGQCGRLVAIFVLLAFSTAWASDVLAVISLPYGDDLLARADAWLGVDWRVMIAAFHSYPGLLRLLSHAYLSLSWQPMLLLVLLGWCRGPREGWRFLTAWALALALCLVVFPFCPAVGGYVHFHIPQHAMPDVLDAEAWNYWVLLEALRNGTVTLLSSASIGGIIAMPSFHAAAAVLLAWGFMGFKWLRWPFLLLNVAMLVSSVPIGGHYIVDVVAGSLVAAIAIFAANKWLKRMSARTGLVADVQPVDAPALRSA